MSLTPGARLGPYEVLAPVGAGGMGEVYRARDPRLGRDVAIKVLPSAFSSDAERLHRFEQEARAAAALNHPNILAVHDIGQHNGAPYIVSELLEGETLRGRLNTGALPVRKAVEYAIQIAHGLAAAHEKGITHRDLKPENVFITVDGRVKILDFGLAKLTQTEPAVGALSALPTTPLDTLPGVVLGTIGYMAPEQVRGQQADHRSDIFAFGAILYEMLGGQRAFRGDTAADTMGAILAKDPPDLPVADRHIPPALERIVDRCLEKKPTARFQSAGDLTFALEGLSSYSGVASVVAGSTRPARRERLAWMSAVALVTLMAAAAIVWALRPVPTAPEMRVEINTPPTADPTSLAISPDGQKVVFAATSEGRSRLWLRSLESVSARPLAGTEGYFLLPFWSPDSRSVGFFADGQLKRMDIGGGSAQELANAGLGLGGTWNRDGTILFTPGPVSPIFRIPATGGEPAAVTRLERPQQQHHNFPAFLPDGRHFLYYVHSPEARGVYVGQLDGSETRRLLDADAPAGYASSGHLLFVRQGTLFAQQLDPVRLELTGSPVPVAERVTVGWGLPVAAVSISAAGPLVYRSGSAGQPHFVWVDRSGKEMGKVSPDSAEAIGPSLSPDDRRVALFRVVSGNVDVWLLDLGRSVVSRFTSDAADDIYPIWSPDATRIVFSSNRKGVMDLYQKPASGAGSEELLLSTAQAKFATDWSLDGRFLLYGSEDPKASSDIWASPMDGDRKPFPVVQTNFDERDGRFSPDGKWIAYESNESGRAEIYVQPFPGPGGKWLISTAGGQQARWRRDGKELFYMAPDNRLMAVPIQLASNGQAVEAGAPVPLFGMRISGLGDYMVASTGQQFLMNTVTEEATSPITVILNWDGAQKR